MSSEIGLIVMQKEIIAILNAASVKGLR